MRKVACLAGAAALSLATVFTASAASARPWHHDNWHNGAAVGFGVAGLAAGTLLGAALADAPPPPPRPIYAYDAPPVYRVIDQPPVYRVIDAPAPRESWVAHVRACERAYTSYDPHSDTYIAANGQILACHT